jgi:hypothetical protein
VHSVISVVHSPLFFVMKPVQSCTYSNVQVKRSSFFSTTCSNYFSCYKHFASYGDFTPSQWYSASGHTETNENSLRSNIRAMTSVALTHAVNECQLEYAMSSATILTVALPSFIFHHKRLNFDLIFIVRAGVLTLTIGSTSQFPAYSSS